MRFGQDSGEKCIIVCNLTPIERENYRLGVPLGGYWKEVLNTDSAHYASQNRGNCGHVHADNCPMHRWEFSLNLRLPPLTTLVLMPEKVNGGQISL